MATWSWVRPSCRATSWLGLARLPYREVRAALAELPRWTHYVIGVAVVLLRNDVIRAARGTVVVSSDLPASVGVASSAALEVATARRSGRRRH